MHCFSFTARKFAKSSLLTASGQMNKAVLISKQGIYITHRKVCTTDIIRILASALLRAAGNKNVQLEQHVRIRFVSRAVRESFNANLEDTLHFRPTVVNLTEAGVIALLAGATLLLPHIQCCLPTWHTSSFLINGSSVVQSTTAFLPSVFTRDG